LRKTQSFPKPFFSADSFKKGRANLAYSQSHLAVLFLVERHGMTILPELLQAARKSRNFESGMSETLGLNSREFEEMVEKYIASKFKLVFFITDSYLWWVLIALLFIVGYIATTIRNKKMAAAMEEAERREMEAAKADTIEAENSQPVTPPHNPSYYPGEAPDKKLQV
jgi:flagellar biosynthesis/type III secretory pathway M-ring protein FliF/YscJ